MSFDQPDQVQPDQPQAPEAPQAPEQAPVTDSPSEQPAAPQAPVSEPTEADLKAQLDDMRRALADLEGRLSSGQLTAAPADEQLRQKVAELRQQYADWPQKGSELPQPWDLQAHGLPRPGVDRDFLPPGPNELAPVVVAHNKPILASGMGGPAVAELGELLGKLGYPNTIAQGRNHSYHLDDSVLAAVGAFGRDYGVQEDPTQFPPQHDPAGYVGPYMWEAILRAAANLDRERAAV